MTYTPDQLAAWRANRAPIRAWETRTYNAARKALTDAHRGEFGKLQLDRSWNAARSELCRRHPAEFLAILDGIREADPRPEAQERGEGDEAA